MPPPQGEAERAPVRAVRARLLLRPGKALVEVDGQSHGFGRRPQHDDRRDGWLADKGIQTLRLRAGLILEDIDAAVSMVATAARGDEV